MKALVIILVVVLTGCNNEPTTYDDCILYHLDKAKNKAAVWALYGACRGKFPSPKPVIKKTKVEDYQFAEGFDPYDYIEKPNNEAVKFPLPDGFDIENFRPNTNK